MKKHSYLKMELIQGVLQPILSVLLAWIFVTQGWIKPEYVEVVWAVVIVSVLASLSALLISWFIEYE